MILELTEAQRAFHERIVQFARGRVEPEAAGIDETGAYPRALVAEMAALGLMGLTIPTEWGGAGLDYISYALAIEAISSVSAVLAVIAAVNNSLVAEPLAEFGTNAQKEAWLRRLAAGSSIGAFALSEEHAGSDAANQQSTARLDDRGYVINGKKVWVANAEAADVLVVFAATQPGIRGRGVSAFLVSANTPGIARVAAADSLGVRGLGCMDLAFTNVRVGSDAMLGNPGDGFRIAMWALDGGRVAIAAQALGVGAAALREALSHAKAREAFGQPIGQLPSDSMDARRYGDRAGCGSHADAQGGRFARATEPSDARRVNGQTVRVGSRASRGRQGDADSCLERLPTRLGG